MAPLPASASRARLATLDARRAEYRGRLVQRFWLRFHMSLMLAATVGTGVLANRLLLSIPVHSMALRWTIALVIAYGAFFLFVRVWLAYVGARPLHVDLGDSGNATSGFDVPLPRLPDVFRGAGGRAGGAGASGSWGAGDIVGTPVKAVLEGAGSAGGDNDAGCALVIVGAVLLLLLVAIGGGVVMLIAAAPHTLADAAFSTLLAGGLVKSVRRMDESDWEGSVLRATWKPLAAVAAVTLVAGVVAQALMPGTRTLAEILMLSR